MPMGTSPPQLLLESKTDVNVVGNFDFAFFVTLTSALHVWDFEFQL